MKKRFLQVRSYYDKAMVGLLILMASQPSFAAGSGQGIGGLFENTLSGQMRSLGEGFKVIFFVAGFLLLGFGVFKFISNNPQETTGQKVKWVLIGTALLAMGWLISLMTDTVGAQAGKANISF